MDGEPYLVIQQAGGLHLTVTQAENRRDPMLSKCANPGCSQPFRYLGEGRLFQVERNITPEGGGKSIRKIEHYWLCDGCSRAMRIGVLENEALLIYSDPDGTITTTSPVDTVRVA